MIQREVLAILERRANETAIEHQKRLVYGKLRDKTLQDVDFSEIAEAIYGQEYSSDVARRMIYGSRKTLEAMDMDCVDTITDCDMLAELEAKTLELRKERQRFADQRREFNKLIARDGRKEHLYDALIEAANNLDQTVGVMFDGECDMYAEHYGNEAVLVFSDWHYGLVTDNVFNKYNTEICKERVAAVVYTAIDKIRLHKCNKLHIVVLGDLFHGAIHTSARVASEELVCDQLMQVSEILAQSILQLSGYVNETYVYMTYGNHGRTVQNKADSIHRDNMERLVPWWLEERFRNHEDIIVVPDSGTEFIFVDAAGHDIVASHGDLDSVKESARVLPTLFSKRYGKNVECIILGDKHHRESFEELDVLSMRVGSLCGSDDYANNKRLYSSPSQLLFIVNDKYGIDAEYRIRC